MFHSVSKGYPPKIIAVKNIILKRAMDFYKSINRYSEIKNQEWMIEQLKFDYNFLFGVVKSILIHPVDAKTEKVKYDRKNRGIFHCENSTVETMLSYPRLEKYLIERKLPLKTIPNDRAVLSCDHHALLFASLVRYLGNSIRVRTGYSKYVVDGLTVPHWVTEVFDVDECKWYIVDPERQYKNVERNSFLFAAEVWKEHMETGRAYSSYSGFSGRHGLKYALLCDLNCIFKNELLSYEWRLKAHNRKKPVVAATSYERLSDVDKETINLIAKMMLNPDEYMNELWELYRKVVEDQDIQVSGYAEYVI
jgi:hypothetical protein